MFKLPKIDIPAWFDQKFQLAKFAFPKLQIGDSVANIPIIQGGMGVGISLSGLASAVAREGGIGVIAANAIGMIEPDYFKNGREANRRALRKEIIKARQNSNGIIGVNIMMAVKDFSDLLQVCIEEKADMVFLGAGLPIKNIPVKELRKAKVKVVPIISSARAANLILRSWQKYYNDIPDGFIVEGPKAGGHLGFKKEQVFDPDFKLEVILPQVICEARIFEESFKRKIPIIAAGGIFNGEDIQKFLNLGAAGIQMGTRFVTTHECDADIRFKKTYIDCKEKDIVLIKSPVGLIGRAIKNQFLEKVNSNLAVTFRCPWKCLENCNIDTAKYCISIALNNARKGNFKNGYAFVGANAFRIKEIISVKELLTCLREEYLAVVNNKTISIKNEFEKALERLAALKDEYTRTIEKNLRILKIEYEKLLKKESDMLRKEYKNIVAKISRLKKEYMNNYNKINELKLKMAELIACSGKIRSPN